MNSFDNSDPEPFEFGRRCRQCAHLVSPFSEVITNACVRCGRRKMLSRTDATSSLRWSRALGYLAGLRLFSPLLLRRFEWSYLLHTSPQSSPPSTWVDLCGCSRCIATLRLVLFDQRRNACTITLSGINATHIGSNGPVLTGMGNRICHLCNRYR